MLSGLSTRPRASQLLDIGSGDGRIVMATASAGFRSTGIEINPWLVLYSKIRSWREADLRRSTRFVRGDLWKFPLTDFDNVVVFGVEEMMAPLSDKMETELKPGTRIVVCRFPVERWKPSSTIGEGVDTVWVYDR